jgi:PIF1-like helicase
LTAVNMITRIHSGGGAAVARWRETDCLVIDEVSMLCSGLFDRLEFIARTLRGRQQFFGGIQLILCGDFFQLQPPMKWAWGWAFEAVCWTAKNLKMFELTTVYRQHEEELLGMLARVRRGDMGPEVQRVLKLLIKQPHPAAATLMATNDAVNKINRAMYVELGRKEEFQCVGARACVCARERACVRACVRVRGLRARVRT